MVKRNVPHIVSVPLSDSQLAYIACLTDKGLTSDYAVVLRFLALGSVPQSFLTNAEITIDDSRLVITGK